MLRHVTTLSIACMLALFACEGASDPSASGSSDPTSPTDPAGVADATSSSPLADASLTPDGGDASSAEAGPRYPGLPTSCQPLFNHGAGGCIDTWSGGAGPWIFQADVEQAVAAIPTSNTAIFDPDGSVPIAKRPAFVDAIVKQLDAKGLCAAMDGDELYVRNGTRDYDETFTLWTRSAMPRVGGHYQCEPASAIPGAPLPVPFPPQACNGTYLPPGTTAIAACQQTGATSLWFADVEAAVLAVIADESAKTSSLVLDTAHWNLNLQAGWEDKSFRIKDNVFFLDAVAQKLQPKGYCYTHNAYDTIILKRDLSRSEDFDLVQAVSCGGSGPACRPNTPAGEYIRYPGKGGFCALAEF